MKTKNFSLNFLDKQIVNNKLSNCDLINIEKDIDKVFFFHFDNEPNIEVGDHITIKINFDSSYSEHDAVVLDKLPPLSQPASEEIFQVHKKALQKYFVDVLIEQIEKDYLYGSAKKSGWMLYFEIENNKGK